MGAEAVQGETRYNANFPLDNVNDYNGFNMNPIVDITNNPIAGLGAYTAGRHRHRSRGRTRRHRRD